MTRIILADDHEMLRAGLKGLLEKEPDFKVVAQAKDGEELLEKLAAVKADCVVMDLSMPNMDGLACLKEIRKKFPKTRVLVLTMQKDTEHFKHAMSIGFLLPGLGWMIGRDLVALIVGDPGTMARKAAPLPHHEPRLTGRQLRNVGTIFGIHQKEVGVVTPHFTGAPDKFDIECRDHNGQRQDQR